MKNALVIGYGNSLRSDDGVGVWVAERIADLHLPGVDVQTCHQLHLELIPDIVEYETVILVDAEVGGTPLTVRESLPALVLPSSSDHSVRPETLQQLAKELYGVLPDMRLYTVRGENFEFGTALTTSVIDRANEAVEQITAFLQRSSLKSLNVDHIFA